MQNDMLFILKKLGAFVFYAAVVSAFTSFLFIDVHFLHDIVKESSLTEIGQELVLVAIVLLHLWLMRNPALRASSLLVAGFFACMLIREMDFALDEIRHGSWFWVASMIALGCLIFAATDAKRALQGLAGYFRHPSYGLLCAGLLNVLVFSRLMGIGALWRSLLDEDYLRAIKNTVEEGSELFGYGLCLLATVSYARDKHKSTQPATHRPG
ncbi:hypothetical protein [Acerihabitans arboris]|uniref:Uncharacterized protein n=1 Tax=Acerihabitans arboris TaxID=2691583 RepID=A0A845SDH0_9GAMM|nr:hypothetical protein [Acerihabitans arboris]NDL61939.1 hypothetical protein [Acerihabitans arboris]